MDDNLAVESSREGDGLGSERAGSELGALLGYCTLLASWVLSKAQADLHSGN